MQRERVVGGGGLYGCSWKKRIDKAVRKLLRAGHAEGLSRSSWRGPAPFSMPLRRGIGWGGCLNSIFKIQPDRISTKGEKIARG